MSVWVGQDTIGDDSTTTKKKEKKKSLLLMRAAKMIDYIECIDMKNVPFTFL